MGVEASKVQADPATCPLPSPVVHERSSRSKKSAFPSGSIRFSGGPIRRPAKWVKLPAHCDEVAVAKQLLDLWELEAPSAVVSLIGPSHAGLAVGIDAGDTRALDDALKACCPDFPLKEFQDGLRHALSKSRSWLITDGVDDGVGGLLGRPGPRDTQDASTCIGISSWSSILGRQLLDRAKSGQCLMYDRASNLTHVPASGRGTAPLQPQHGSFLLLDADPAQTGGRDGASQPAEVLREALEQYINAEDLSGDGVKTPIVLVLINGNADSLRRVDAALSRGDPVLVVLGTGGAADDIHALYSWQAAYEGRGAGGDSALRGEHEHIEWLLPGPRKTKEYMDSARRLIPHILACGAQTGANASPQLAFFRFDSETDDTPDFSNAILSSLLDSCVQDQDDVMLAVQWGQPEILDTVLERSAFSVDKKSCRIVAAFEAALLRVASDLQGPEIVDLLINLTHIDPSTVRLDRLFQESRNRYELEVWYAHFTATGKRAEAKIAQELGVKGSGNGNRWMDVLDTHVPEYKEHLKARSKIYAVAHGTVWSAGGGNRNSGTDGGQQAVATTWTDLMLWAVLIGNVELARRMWSKTRQPMRAALMASQLCRSLSKKNHLFSDSRDLLELSLEYERWAIKCLDAIGSAEEAMPLLGLVPTIVPCATRHGEPPPRPIQLWTESPLDSAICDDEPSEACKNFVTHRHVRLLLRSFFSGDYPGSKARIDRNAWAIEVATQVFLFFLPGTVCEVMDPRDTNAEPDSAGGHEAEGAVMAAACMASELDNLHWDAEYLQEPTKHDSQVNWRSENSFADVWADMRSLRAFHFFSVPMVKFVTYGLSSVAYNLCLTILIVSDPRPQQLGRMLPFAPFTHASGGFDFLELFFWLWSALRLYAEIREMPSYDLKGLRIYWKPLWNKMDVVNSVMVLIIVILRMGCAAGGGDGGAGSAYFWSLCDGTEEGGCPVAHCDNLEEWSRVLYGFLALSNWFRLIQLFDYWERFGVLRIIFFKMVETDFLYWMVFVVFISLGTGVALAAMIPNRMFAPKFPDLHNSPLWTPVWGLLGDFDLDVVEDAIGWNAAGAPPTRSIVPLTILVYMLMANVVLVNLLIAQMSSTYEALMEVATEEWIFNRAHLILEFKDSKRTLPPPLNIFTLLLWDVPSLLIWACRGVRPKSPGSSMLLDGLKYYSPPRVLLWAMQRECAACAQVVKSMSHEDSIDHKMDDIHDQLKEGQAGLERSIAELNAKLDRVTRRLADGIAPSPRKRTSLAPAPRTSLAPAPRTSLAPAPRTSLASGAPYAEVLPPVRGTGGPAILPPNHAPAFLASLPPIGAAENAISAAQVQLRASIFHIRLASDSLGEERDAYLSAHRGASADARNSHSTYVHVREPPFSGREDPPSSWALEPSDTAGCFRIRLVSCVAGVPAGQYLNVHRNASGAMDSRTPSSTYVHVHEQVAGHSDLASEWVLEQADGSADVYRIRLNSSFHGATAGWYLSVHRKADCPDVRSALSTYVHVFKPNHDSDLAPSHWLMEPVQ